MFNEMMPMSMGGGDNREVYIETQSVNTTYSNSFNIGFVPKMVGVVYLDSSTNRHFIFKIAEYDEENDNFSGYYCYATASYQESYTYSTIPSIIFSDGVLTTTTTSATGFNGKTVTIVAV